MGPLPNANAYGLLPDSSVGWRNRVGGWVSASADDVGVEVQAGDATTCHSSSTLSVPGTVLSAFLWLSHFIRTTLMKSVLL